MAITIEEAVRLEIAKFINEDVAPVLEKKSKKSKHKKDKPKKDLSHKEKESGKNAIKTKGGGRKNIDYKADKKSNPNISKADQGDLERILNSPVVNLTTVAKELYPGHTDTGAESQLRKKLKGEKSDSGSTYRIKRKEARRLRRILAKMLNF